MVVSIILKGNTIARLYRIAGQVHLTGPLPGLAGRLALAQMSWRSADAEQMPRSEIASGLPLVPYHPTASALSLAAENPDS